MNRSQDLQDQVKDFLQGRLEGEQLDAFLKRLSTDPLFKERVLEYANAIQGLQHYRSLMLKEQLKRLEVQNRKRKALRITITRVAAAVLLLLSVPLYLQLGFHLSQQPVAVQPLDQPLDNKEDLLVEEEVDVARTKEILPELEYDVPFTEQMTDQRPNQSKEKRLVVSNSTSKDHPVIEEVAQVEIKPLPKAAYPQLTEVKPVPQEGEWTNALASFSLPSKSVSTVLTESSSERRSIPKIDLAVNEHLAKAVIQGQVREQNSNQGIPGVVLVGSKGLVTDQQGRFTIEIDPGAYMVEARMLGYQDARRKVKASPGQILDLNLMMVASVTQLQTLTVTASKFNKPFSELSTSADVVQTKALEKHAVNSIDQYLQKVPGVNIIDGQLNIRGGSGFAYGTGSRVALLLDGVPALQGDAAFPDWNLMPTENITQMEVIKGAASALYGSSALNGVINVRTGFAGDEPMTKISGFTTTYFSPKDAEKKWWGTDSTTVPFATGVSLMHAEKIGRFDFVAGFHGTKEESFRKGDNNQYVRTHLKARYRANKRLMTGLNANVQFGNSSKGFIWENWQEGAYVSLPDAVSRNNNLRLMVDPYLNIKDKLGNEHRINSRYYFWDNDQANAVSDQSNLGHQVFGEYQFQRHFDDSDLTITSGSNAMITTSQAKLYGDTSHHFVNLAGYVHADQKLWERLNLSFGARLEYNLLSGEPREARQLEPVFRIGANFRATDQTYLRASWGQGYRSPTIAEKYISTNIEENFRIYPNPELRPERGWTGEIGIKQGFRTPQWKGFFDISGFWMEYSDMMEFSFRQWGTFNDPLWGFGFGAQNVGNTRIRGVELGVTGEGKAGPFDATCSLGYTYIDPRYKSFHPDTARSSVDYNVLKYRFRHTMKMDMELKYKKLTIGLGGRFNSSMEAIDEFFVNQQLLTVAELTELGIAEYRELNPGGAFVLDARLIVEPSPNLTLSLIGGNILNTEYTLRPGLMEAPANLTMRLSYRI